LANLTNFVLYDPKARFTTSVWVEQSRADVFLFFKNIMFSLLHMP